MAAMIQASVLSLRGLPAWAGSGSGDRYPQSNTKDLNKNKKIPKKNRIPSEEDTSVYLPPGTLQTEVGSKQSCSPKAQNQSPDGGNKEV